MQKEFSTKKVSPKKRPDGKKYSCLSCKRYENCNTKRMMPYGNFKKKIIIMGDTPEEIDDKKGMPWQGREGRFLQKALTKVGIDLFEDCLSINSVHCFTEKEPSNFEIECCRKRNMQFIKMNPPKLIIVLGDSAVFSLIGHRWKRDLGKISKWRGWTIPDQDFMAWVCPTFHPYFLMENEDGAEMTIGLQDLKRAVETLEKPFPVYKEPHIEVIEDLYMLTNIRSRECAFDYETTGIKPYAAGHRIVCCAIADTVDHAYAFMMPKTRAGLAPFKDFLADPKICKIAQNMKFEEAWSVERVQQPVIGWIWDTMLASHILDNRIGVTGLKFQTYVQLGVVDYESEVSPYLKATDNKDANALNKILELLEVEGGKEKLLLYDGYDAINTLRIAKKQKEEMLIDCLPF